MSKSRIKTMPQTAAKKSRTGRPAEMKNPRRTFVNWEDEVVESLKQEATLQGCSFSRLTLRIVTGQAPPLRHVG